MWELQDLVTALPLALESERLDEPERERASLCSLLQYGCRHRISVFDRDSVRKGRQSRYAA